MRKTSDHPTGFTLFAFAWAVSGLFHQLSFVDWRWHSIPGVILSGTIIWVLLKPSSWVRFALLLAVDFVGVALAFPVHPNHIVFAWVINATMLSALVLAMRQHPAEGDLATRWYNVFAPWLRVELYILYFITVFHKLNVSYFELDNSCAANMYLKISEVIPLFPDAKWAQYCAIYGTLIFETSIPLLLLCGRTRRVGVIVGIVFHGLIALHPHRGLFSFSSVMLALFSVFIPAKLAMSLQPPRLLRTILPWGLAAFASLLVLWFFRDLLPSWVRRGHHWHNISASGLLAFFIYLLVCLFMLVSATRTKGSENLAPLDNTWRTSPALIVFPWLLLVNGFGPYFGLRTQTSFSMFSNLQTENGKSNHLIIPSGIQLTDWQYDLVEIIDSNDPELIMIRENNYLLPYLDLRRRRGRCSANMWVTFRRNGVTSIFDAARIETHNILLPLGFLEKRYFYFRPIDRDPLRVKCKH